MLLFAIWSPLKRVRSANEKDLVPRPILTHTEVIEEEGMSNIYERWIIDLISSVALNELVLNTIRKWGNLHSGNTIIEAIITVTHCVIIIVTGLSYERTKIYIYYSFKDEALISNLLVTNQVTLGKLHGLYELVL